MNDTDPNIAHTRASMPKGAHEVLDRRTLQNDNKNLLPLLKKGMRVMDVGCGSGAITAGIAEVVGQSGFVVGIDPSVTLIASAKARFSNLKNLTFRTDDIMTQETTERYDLITSARTLQWLNQPGAALSRMKALLTESGCLSILDYNHEKIEWHPTPPASVLDFYQAFLRWRSDAGFYNQIADQLEELLMDAGLTKIEITQQIECVGSDDPEFQAAAGIWNVVAKTRGKQMVADGYLAEAARTTAIDDYSNWLTYGTSMSMYLLAATGYQTSEINA